MTFKGLKLYSSWTYGLIIFQQTTNICNWQYANMLRRSFQKGNARHTIQDVTHDVTLCAKKKSRRTIFYWSTCPENTKSFPKGSTKRFLIHSRKALQLGDKFDVCWNIINP